MNKNKMGKSLKASPEFKEVSKLRKQLLQRFERIEKKGLSSFAKDKYQKLELGKFDFKSVKDIKKRIKDLKYILGLKSSTIVGARKFEKVWKPISDKIGDDQQLRDKFFDLYEKAVELNGVVKNYKYESFEYISQQLDDYKDEDELDTILDIIRNANTGDFMRSKDKSATIIDYINKDGQSVEISQRYITKHKKKRR